MTAVRCLLSVFLERNSIVVTARNLSTERKKERAKKEAVFNNTVETSPLRNDWFQSRLRYLNNPDQNQDIIKPSVPRSKVNARLQFPDTPSLDKNQQAEIKMLLNAVNSPRWSSMRCPVKPPQRSGCATNWDQKNTRKNRVPLYKWSENEEKNEAQTRECGEKHETKKRSSKRRRLGCCLSSSRRALEPR